MRIILSVGVYLGFRLFKRLVQAVQLEVFLVHREYKRLQRQVPLMALSWVETAVFYTLFLYLGVVIKIIGTYRGNIHELSFLSERIIIIL